MRVTSMRMVVVALTVGAALLLSVQPAGARTPASAGDTDGDGFLDETEVSLGSNPNNAASTPEHLVLASVCQDGVDNDLDGVADRFDPGCSLVAGTALDPDRDGLAGGQDVCPFVYDPLQGDADADGKGDVCDPDDNNDGTSDFDDGAIAFPNCVAAREVANDFSQPAGVLTSAVLGCVEDIVSVNRQLAEVQTGLVAEPRAAGNRVLLFTYDLSTLSYLEVLNGSLESGLMPGEQLADFEGRVRLSGILDETLAFSNVANTPPNLSPTEEKQDKGEKQLDSLKELLNELCDALPEIEIMVPKIAWRYIRLLGEIPVGVEFEPKKIGLKSTITTIAKVIDEIIGLLRGGKGGGGGTSEVYAETMVDPSGPSTRPADGSGPAVPYGALAGGAAAAAVALAASGWYVRHKRRLR